MPGVDIDNVGEKAPSVAVTAHREGTMLRAGNISN
jgi:hypothetical protein